MDIKYILDFSSALFILILIIFHSFTIRKEKKSEIIFMTILYFMLAFDICSGIINCLMIVKVNKYVILTLKNISTIFFSLISSGFASYTYFSIKETYKLPKKHYIFILWPIIFNVILLFINGFTGFAFYIEDGIIEYKWAYNLFFLEYIVIMFYMPIMALIYRKELYYSTFRLSFTFAILSAVYGIVQLITYHALNSFFSLSTLFFSLLTTDAYLYIQNDRMNIDTSTNLYLRNQCVEKLRKASNVTVYLIEIIRFHHFSALTRDKIINSIVSYLKSFLDRYTIYRVSNNQLVINIKNMDDIDIISRIIKNYKEPVEIEGDQYKLNLKLAAMTKTKEMNAEHTIYLLETMISTIKDTEKSYIVYNKEFEEKLKENEIKTKKILKAISEEDGVVPYFQGIYSFDEKKIVLCEALARLKINNQLIMPSNFIPVLEDQKYIHKLDNDILKKVINQIDELKKSNKKIDLKGITINFTADDILNPTFIDCIKKLIKDFKLDTDMLCFEISESAVINNYQKVKEVMQELSACGIKFFLDDFGTGFSNIKTVLSLPFHVIKIDKSLLDAAKENVKNQQIFNGIINAINSTGIKTLVEGVETQSDLNLVKNAGAHYIQGYYFHKPSDFNELCKKIEKY